MLGKEFLDKFKKKYNEIMMGTYSITKIMTDKVSDMIILKELPASFIINKKWIIYVGNFNLENEKLFFHKWKSLVGLMVARITNLELSTERKKDLLEKADFHMLANGKWMYEFIMKDDWFYKKLCKLLRNTLINQQQFIAPNHKDEENRMLVKWRNANWKWWKKNVDSETLIQICAAVYLWNFDAVKKNLKVLAGKMGVLQETDTYIYFWLQKWAGLNGEFLSAQAPSIDYAFRDKPNDNNNQQKSQQDFDVVGTK